MSRNLSPEGWKFENSFGLDGDLRVRLLYGLYLKRKLYLRVDSHQKASDLPQTRQGEFVKRVESEGRPSEASHDPTQWAKHLQYTRSALWDRTRLIHTHAFPRHQFWTLRAAISYWDDNDIEYTFGTHNGIPQPEKSCAEMLKVCPLPHYFQNNIFTMPVMDRRHVRNVPIRVRVISEYVSESDAFPEKKYGKTASTSKALRSSLWKTKQLGWLKRPSRCTEWSDDLEKIGGETDEKMLNKQKYTQEAIVISERKSTEETKASETHVQSTAG